MSELQSMITAAMTLSGNRERDGPGTRRCSPRTNVRRPIRHADAFVGRGMESRIGAMSDNVSDRELVERVQRGERRAFDLLMLKYQHRIAKLIARYVQDPSEALDVAQDAFMKAYRAIPRFRGDSAFYTWMYRIAINTAKNHLAAQARRPRDSGVDVADAEQFDGVAELKESVTPEGLALTEEIQQTVAAAIEALPEDLRVAISLRELEGFSYEDIARVMECPIGTVRSRIFRAREAINARLDPLLD